jgi:Ca-activated chloride channel family protein
MVDLFDPNLLTLFAQASKDSFDGPTNWMLRDLTSYMLAEIATAAVLVITLGAEIIHLGRVRRMATLAFGPSRRPSLWARLAPAFRVLGLTALTWGLVSLLTVPPKTHNAEAVDLAKQRHVVLLLDVSPSMRLADAGPEGAQSRTQRARVVIESLFDRVPIRQYKLSVIAFYNKSIPVVIDTHDMEVVKNTLSDLPMHFAFEGKQTDLFAGLEKVVETTKPWQPKSTILLIVTDGDVVPATGMPKMPISIASTLVIGVGDPVKGTFISGKNSRQDISMLRQAAARLRGEFHNGNEKHISSNVIRELTQETSKQKWSDLGRREYALIAIAIGSALLMLLPILLNYFGSSYRVGVATRGLS